MFSSNEAVNQGSEAQSKPSAGANNYLTPNFIEQTDQRHVRKRSRNRDLLNGMDDNFD